MATKVLWARRASGDLEAIHAFISRDSAHYADAVARKIVMVVSRLEQFPSSGRVVPEVGDVTLREVISSRYRIVYRLMDNEVTVLTVHDSARDFPNL